MPTKTLEIIANEMIDQIEINPDMGWEAPRDLFKAMWVALTSGPNSQSIQDAINLVEQAFEI